MHRIRLGMVRWAFVIMLGSTLGFVGCMATYKAGSVDSPDGRYLVSGRIRGAYGRAFIDQTKKTVFVTLFAKSGGKEKLLFQRQYRVQGSDVCWDANWDTDDNLTLVLYDYGLGVSFYDARKNGTPKRHLQTVACRFDSKTGRYVEQPTK
jgi:hypothetical protein